MNEKFNRYFQYFREMSPLKKVLIVFVALLIFIIVVEQPGSDSSKRAKNERYFLPRLVADNVQKFEIKKPSTNAITLQKKDGKWKVTNGHDFPADETKVSDFLKSMMNLKQGDLVSKNKEHIGIYLADESTGVHVQVWDSSKQVADFYAGQIIDDGQYLRDTDSDEVYKTIPSLDPYLHQSPDDWKNKTLVSADQDKTTQVELDSPSGELVLAKDTKGTWNEMQPEKFAANELSVRTLFDQLKDLKADSFADSVDASQANFEKPDYRISLRLADNSSVQVSFTGPDKDKKYFAKTSGSEFIYNVSQSFMDNIFGLKFNPDNAKNPDTSLSTPVKGLEPEKTVK